MLFGFRVLGGRFEARGPGFWGLELRAVSGLASECLNSLHLRGATTISCFGIDCSVYSPPTPESEYVSRLSGFCLRA